MEDLKLIDLSFTLREFVKKTKNTFSCGLLISEDEILLTQIAQYYAMAIECEKEYPCFECPTCKKIISKNAIEVFTYPKYKNEISVKDIEEVVDEIIKKPLDFKTKIFIFNRIDNSSEEAQNKLLKSMEEFPSYVKMIFTATNTGKVLPTILSRTVSISIPSLPEKEFIKILMPLRQSNQLEMPIIYNLSSGNLFLGLNILSNLEIKEIYDNCLKILDTISKNNILTFSTMIDKNNIENYIKIFSILIENFLVDKSNNKSNYSIISSRYTIKSLLDIANLLHISYKKIKSNTNEQSVIDNLLIGILEAKI